MPLESEGKVTEVVDQDDNVAAPASDERLDAVRQAVENQGSLTAFEQSTGGTDAEALASNAVPEGVDVVVQAKADNSGAVYVGDGTTQSIRLAPEQSLSLAVTDTGLVYIQTPTAGDGVNVVFEG